MTVVGPHPGASSAAVSRRMSTARRRDTRPELDVRKRLHAQGLRYRVQFPVPGLARRTIDIAFTKTKVAVFVDGCFWHSCPEHGTIPRANSEWWANKLRRNAARDVETTEVLAAAGWRVLRFWEHTDPDTIVAKINSTLVRAAHRPS
ncbi:very short patch repair endonuclease [Cellulosimicrobium cellulans]|uniref:Very short patch repair endonuclease n=1 Tax=Cellulosimicrobium cellulans TaxID=1710 RepID=A0A1Y0HTA6_CELCE|nr:very short patch repair endonuclease [Cellulosimicrobium cellulans]ARU51408.1 very short patch repair endonuclease [Cellulosimicrobium cellulans]